MQTHTTLEPRRKKRTAATISNLELGEDRGKVGWPGTGGERFVQNPWTVIVL
jgi:hypothetical protein